MKNLIVFTLILFFSTSTFVNHAKSLEYTVLTDAEVEYLLQTYTDINDLWYGIYVYDSEDKEEKLGYMHLWNEMESSFSSYNKPVFIEKTDTHFEMFTGEVTEISDTFTQQVFQADPPYNLLYEFSSDTEGGSELTITSTRQKDSMKVLRSDGVNKETEILRNFDYRLNHYLSDLIFLLPNQSIIGKTVKNRDFADGEFAEFVITLSEIREQIVQGVPYKYFVYDAMWDDGEFPISGEMLVDANMIPISFWMEDLQMEMRLEDKEVAQDINNQRDFYLANTIPLDRDFYEILENNSHTNVKNIFLEIQGDYNNQFPTAFQQEVVQIEGINYLVLGNSFADTEYGIWEEATKSDIQKNLDKKKFDPIDDPVIIDLAKKGINGATNIEDKLTNLLSFVSDYIEDTYAVGSVTTVYDIIEQQSGDCSEHAFLFNILARSIGIPSRIASGYAYDPQSQSFGGHAWNEVVVDGYWYPVDPTWNWESVYGHIKEDEKLNPFFNNIKFKLSLIQFENGNEQFF